MSKLNKKESKQMLNEWKHFLSEHRIISLDEIIETIFQSGRDEKEAEYLRAYWNNNRFITKYTQVIQNEINNTQESIEEILDVCKLHYEKIYQSAGPRIKDLIGGGNTTVDELRKQIDFKSNPNKSEVRKQCAYQNERPVVGKYDDFNVVYSEADFIVIEPKTIQGSIAWAHGKPDGSEETDQKRRVGWCTGVSTINNMFPNYAGNLHMFYVIRTDYDDDKSANRRICLSFTVKDGKPEFKTGGATVNALNRSLKENDLNKIKAERYYQDILQRLQGRKNTSFSEMYSKCTLSQFLRLKAQMEAQKLNEYIIGGEIDNYAKYSIDVDLLAYLLDNDTPEINPGTNRQRSITILRRDDLTKLKRSNVLIKKIINSSDPFIKANIARRDDLLDIDPSGQLIKDFVNSKNEAIRASIAYHGNLYTVDPTGGLTKQLASDEDDEVRASLAQNKNLLNSNSSNTLIDLIKQLASDENEDVRKGLVRQEDLFRDDLVSADFNFFNELLTKLANDIDAIRYELARQSTWFNVDSNEKILNLLINDSDEYVRRGIASNSEIFNLENPKIIERLLSDSDEIVVTGILNNLQRNTDLTKNEIQTMFSNAYKNIQNKIFDNFKNTKFKHKHLNDAVETFVAYEEIFNKKDVEKLYKLVIKKISEGFNLTNSCMTKLLIQLDNNDTFTEEKQLKLMKLIKKTDYDSQKFFLEKPDITKKAYIYIAKKALPKKGQGPSQVYSGLDSKVSTFLAVQDPEIAQIFATMASKALLTKLLNSTVNALSTYPEPNSRTFLFKNAYYDRVSSEEALRIYSAAAPVLYKAIKNNPKLKSWPNFFVLEKLLKQKKLVESKQRLEVLSEEVLRKYIQLILT